MRRAKSPSAHEPPPKATAESDASDSAKSQPTKGAADEPVSSRSDQQPEAAATTPTGSTSKHDVPSILSGASRAGAGAANSPDDNGVAAANNEKPGSTRQNSASGSAEWSPDRRSTPASTTSNDGTAKRFAVKGKPLQASDSKPQLANLAAPQGRCVISLVFCLILVTITS